MEDKTQIKLPDESPGGRILIYQSKDNTFRLDVRFQDESVWLTQQQMADLFNTTKQNVSLHIRNIYSEGELVPEATVKKYLTVQNEGEREIRRFWSRGLFPDGKRSSGSAISAEGGRRFFLRGN
jgi:hypothetical protein